MNDEDNHDLNNDIVARRCWSWLLQQSAQANLEWEQVATMLRQQIPASIKFVDRWELFAAAWPQQVSPHLLMLTGDDNAIAHAKARDYDDTNTKVNANNVTAQVNNDATSDDKHPLQIYYGERRLYETTNRIASSSEFKQHALDLTSQHSGVCIHVELCNEFDYGQHCVCIWICHKTKIIDCFDPQFSPKPSDVLLGKWLCVLFPTYTFRSKSLRPRHLCVQAKRAGFLGCLRGSSDRFCEMYCFLYCLERMNERTDNEACERLCFMLNSDLLDRACQIWQRIRDTFVVES